MLDTFDGYICNSRPRRFSKSYAANMLTAYYSKGCDSKKMFSCLEISKDSDFKRHLNKYDVIHIDVQWFLSSCENVKDVVRFISSSILEELKDIYPNVPLDNVFAVGDGLSRIREKTGQKFLCDYPKYWLLCMDYYLSI